MDRRSFLTSSVAAMGALALPAPWAPPLPRDIRRWLEPDDRELADVALTAARGAGAAYADIRISRHFNQAIATRERRVESMSDQITYGFGVRALVDGVWGFAASRVVEADEVAQVARRAVEQARVNARIPHAPVELAPVDAYTAASWTTPHEIDPFEVPIDEKVSFLLEINAAALAAGADFASSAINFQKQERYFASSEGSYIDQVFLRVFVPWSVTAVDRQGGSFAEWDDIQTNAGAGWEFVEAQDFHARAARAAGLAREKLSAPTIEGPMKKDLVLLPNHLWLTIHESVGHPTELDRALGYEANFAGTSFCTVDQLNELQYASPIVSFEAEKQEPNSLATVGWDDDGVPADRWFLVKDGLFVDFQTTRDQVHWIEQQTGVRRSHGCSYGEDWSLVQFQRMPNINLVPDPGGGTLDDLIAGIDDGLLIDTRGSYSIDQQRYNFQFAGQGTWEIVGGKRGRMLRDVAYQDNTVEFWNRCDGLGGPDTYEVHGSYYDGKGQPGQSNAVSHGCPPARFRQVNVLPT
ncbi:MAG TPA: TldD/PmbA family protein [Gemmatimonadota bacterium]|nr:TldD/PmbA family protein [Gemmatimonadota bacterium]